jgi:hypothetical protein
LRARQKVTDASLKRRAIKNFVAEIEFNHESFTRGEQAYASTDRLRLFELVGRRSRLLWIRHRNLSWYALAVEKKNLPPVEPAGLTLTGMQAGAYRVEYWIPEEGKLLRTAELRATRTILTVPLPEIRTEIALKVRAGELIAINGFAAAIVALGRRDAPPFHGSRSCK